MKRLFLVLYLIITAPTYATTMCVANDSIVVVLDPSISISGAGNSGMLTWWASASYGVFYGVGACLNSAHGMGRWGSVSKLTDTNNNGETKRVVGSETYGRYCWCRLSHPVASLWVYGTLYGSSSSCASDCVAYCGRGFRDNFDQRTSLIIAIEN